MDLVGFLTDHAGLVVYTVVTLAMVVYLAKAMIHPERF